MLRIKIKIPHLLALATILIAGGGVALYLAAHPALPLPETFSATRGNVIQEISAKGKVKQAKQIEIAFLGSGTVSTLSVGVGDRVRAGREIARLALGEIETQKTDAETSLLRAQNMLKQMLARPDKKEIAGAEALLSSAANELEQIKEKMRNADAAYATQLAQTQKDARNVTVSSYHYARSAHETFSDLFVGEKFDDMFIIASVGLALEVASFGPTIDALVASSSVSTSTLTETSPISVVATAQSELIDALNALKEGLRSAATAMEYATVSVTLDQEGLSARKNDITTARLNVITALADMREQQRAAETKEMEYQKQMAALDEAAVAAQKSRDKAEIALQTAQMPPTSSEIARQRAEVDKAQTTLDLLKEKIRTSILHAPVDGTITDIAAQAGERVRAGAVIASILNDSKLDIEAYLPESDIVKVRIDDLTTVTLDADGRRETLPGKVAMIDPAELKVEGIIYYKTTVVFENTAEGVRPGTDAQLKIKTAAAENVLLIPMRSLVEQGDGTYAVRILRDGNAIEERNVEVGLFGSDAFVEIISGISEGDRIMVAPEVVTW